MVVPLTQVHKRRSRGAEGCGPRKNFRVTNVDVHSKFLLVIRALVHMILWYNAIIAFLQKNRT